VAFLDDLAASRFSVPCLEPDDYAVVAGLERKYADLDVGLADLAVVVLAGRLNTRRLLTSDERHFRTLRSLKGAHFILLPADDPPTH
jgi:predicted nucleic acid-binding protein